MCHSKKQFKLLKVQEQSSSLTSLALSALGKMMADSSYFPGMSCQLRSLSMIIKYKCYVHMFIVS